MIEISLNDMIRERDMREKPTVHAYTTGCEAWSDDMLDRAIEDEELFERGSAYLHQAYRVINAISGGYSERTVAELVVMVCDRVTMDQRPLTEVEVGKWLRAREGVRKQC